MGGPGSGGYPPDDPADWLQLIEEIPTRDTIGATLEAHGRDWRQLGRMRRRHPEIEQAYQEARQAQAGRQAEKALRDLDPELLRGFDPKQASAVANMLANRARAAQWLAERNGRGDYGQHTTHTHDVTVHAVVALPALQPLQGTVGDMGARIGTDSSPRALNAATPDVAQAVDAEVVSVESHDDKLTD